MKYKFDITRRKKSCLFRPIPSTLLKLTAKYTTGQGDKKSTQQVNYGKAKALVPKKSYWLLQGMTGD